MTKKNRREAPLVDVCFSASANGYIRRFINQKTGKNHVRVFEVIIDFSFYHYIQAKHNIQEFVRAKGV